MSSTALQAQIDAARAYESLFVPALFDQWTSRLVDAAQIRPGDKVLDVACGTGVLARAAQVRAGPTGYVAALDPNPGMLAVAQERAPDIEWRQGVAESIPFSGNSFDAVISQFGLMFFEDRLQALREMVRVLLPEGRLVVAVWDGLSSMPAFETEVALLERLAGSRAADALRGPFVLGDRETLAALFVDAGAEAVGVTTQRGTARFPSIRTMVEADLRGWLPIMGVELTEDQIESILQQADTELAEYVGPDGSTFFEIRAHVVTATKH